MFLGHTVDTTSPDIESAFAPREVGIHAFRIWSGGDQDPRDDLDRYRFLRGLQDTGRTIDPPTPRPNDYRFLVSAGPFARIPAGSTLTFQVAFVFGNMIPHHGSGLGPHHAGAGLHEPDPGAAGLRRRPGSGSEVGHQARLLRRRTSR